MPFAPENALPNAIVFKKKNSEIYVPVASVNNYSKRNKVIQVGIASRNMADHHLKNN